jgi:HPt (histidine-containing phosphotransfer) domain-containing protein
MTQEIPTKLVINCETGEREIIPLTEEEIAEREAMAAQALADQAEREAAEQAKQEAKASAIAKLTALGLDADEIAALVG